MVKHRVAFQGEPGAYSEMAASQYFSNAELVPMRSFQEVFDIIEAGKVDFAVVPIENSIEGSISETYDLLFLTNMLVSGEIYQRIRHCLITNKHASSTIKSAYSHPQALGQCRRYLQFKGLEPVPTYDTAGAVKLIKEKQLTEGAAIASKRAAEIYEMEILEEGIEDKKNNFTRFLVLSKNETKPTNNDRTSIIFSVRHIPGALFSILEEFAHRQINLTKIESRPTKETLWEYNFFVDLEGHATDENIAHALQLAKSKSAFFKILGSYKKAELY
ncbi:MAG TPA: prephenate dehydratase [Nitrososphaeraceae archaeon]|nr:prephenate dehydratase [Nitrososphaeraceae archaeon]